MNTGRNVVGLVLAASLAGCGGGAVPAAMQAQSTSAAASSVRAVTANVPALKPTFALIYAFGNGSDGMSPYANVIDVNGTLYGTTSGGGAYGYGTVFSVSTSGAETVVHSFGNGTDGQQPLAGLIDVN